MIALGFPDPHSTWPSVPRPRTRADRRVRTKFFARQCAARSGKARTPHRSRAAQIDPKMGGDSRASAGGFQKGLPNPFTDPRRASETALREGLSRIPPGPLQSSDPKPSQVELHLILFWPSVGGKITQVAGKMRAAPPAGRHSERPGLHSPALGSVKKRSGAAEVPAGARLMPTPLENHPSPSRRAPCAGRRQAGGLLAQVATLLFVVSAIALAIVVLR